MFKNHLYLIGILETQKVYANYLIWLKVTLLNTKTKLTLIDQVNYLIWLKVISSLTLQ